MGKREPYDPDNNVGVTGGGFVRPEDSVGPKGPAAGKPNVEGRTPPTGTWAEEIRGDGVPGAMYNGR